MTISPRQVKEARELIGWSKAQLALQSGVGIFVIDKFERGQRTIRPGALAALTNALEAAGIEFKDGDQPRARASAGKPQRAKAKDACFTVCWIASPTGDLRSLGCPTLRSALDRAHARIKRDPSDRVWIESSSGIQIMNDAEIRATRKL